MGGLCLRLSFWRGGVLVGCASSASRVAARRFVCGCCWRGGRRWWGLRRGSCFRRVFVWLRGGWVRFPSVVVRVVWPVLWWRSSFCVVSARGVVGLCFVRRVGARVWCVLFCFRGCVPGLRWVLGWCCCRVWWWLVFRCCWWWCLWRVGFWGVFFWGVVLVGVVLLLVVVACFLVFVFLGVVVWRACLRHCLGARGVVSWFAVGVSPVPCLLGLLSRGCAWGCVLVCGLLWRGLCALRVRRGGCRLGCVRCGCSWRVSCGCRVCGRFRGDAGCSGVPCGFRCLRWWVCRCCWWRVLVACSSLSLVACVGGVAAFGGCGVFFVVLFLSGVVLLVFVVGFSLCVFWVLCSRVVAVRGRNWCYWGGGGVCGRGLGLWGVGCVLSRLCLLLWRSGVLVVGACGRVWACWLAGWLVGWLVPARLGVWLPVGACGRVGRVLRARVFM